MRDDLLGVGSKVRFLDYLIGHDPAYAHVKEWVFGSCPFCGYAQISLPAVCEKYGKKAVLFMAQRSMDNLHEYQRRGIELGAVYHWIPNGMLPVTQKRAKDYAAERPDRMVLPIGLEHPSVHQSIIDIAHSLPFVPDEFWTAGSSGSFNRGLQAAWPAAKAFVVGVGHNMSEAQIGRATHFRSPYKFDRPIKPHEAPPFPSAANYDAKVWPILLDYYRKKAYTYVLFWNVGS